MKTRISLNDSTIDVVVKMAEGNPGAAVVMREILEKGSSIDPENLMGGMGSILYLDTFNIYGSRIWMLYKDVCKQNITHTLAVIRSVQMGFLSREALNKAIDNYGEGIAMDQIVGNIQQALPNFGKGDSDGL